MGKLSGKVAVVTGASKGIGAAIATGLAEAGAAVVVNYASSREGAEHVVAGIVGAGGRAIAVQADVSKEADVQRLFAEAKAAFGTVGILVNNAAIYRFAFLEESTTADFHEHFDTNVLSVFLACREAVRQFGPDGGSIINISSTGVVQNTPMASVYIASKAAVESMTRVLAAELGPKRIRVNAIAPGTTETEGMQTIAFFGTDYEPQTIAATPLGRIGRPDDIAPIAVFLASDESGWITGDTLLASGGLR